jgi:hypothetical protein
MPTLKEYLESNGVDVTPDQRSKLGLSFSHYKTDKLVLENGFWVKDYDYNFLESEPSQIIIISFLKTLM